MSEVLSIVHRVDRNGEILERYPHVLTAEDLFAEMSLTVDAKHWQTGMAVHVGERHEGHTIVLNREEARRVAEQLLKYADGES